MRSEEILIAAAARVAADGSVRGRSPAAAPRKAIATKKVRTTYELVSPIGYPRGEAQAE